MAAIKRSTVTQNDVAKEAGVTRSMVSYVISGNTDRSVAPETRKRILDAIEKLDYRPNKAAQALQQGNIAFASKQIGVVLCSPDVFRRPYYAEILEGIHTAAHENNYHVRFIRFFDELKDSVLFNTLIQEEEIGSMILVSTDQCLKNKADYDIIEKIRSRIHNIVCVEWRYDGLSSINFNRRESSKKACDYLISKGITDISYIGQSDERLIGVHDSLSEHGIPRAPNEYFLEETYNMGGGFEAAKRAHKKLGKLPRGIVCGSDEVAIGILCYLNSQKISVPDQVALVSIDNIEMSEFTNPPLTTINVQKRAMGSMAVSLLVNGQAKQGSEALDITLPVNIVERSSC